MVVLLKEEDFTSISVYVLLGHRGLLSRGLLDLGWWLGLSYRSGALDYAGGGPWKSYRVCQHLFIQHFGEKK